MELLKAIEIADRLCPNPYTTEEKLIWCQEVSQVIRREINKIYDTIETNIDSRGELLLPDGVAFEDVEAAYIDGKCMEKLDFRSFMSNNNPGSGRIKLVYLTKPKPVRQTTIFGNFNIGENHIEMLFPPFVPGDKLEWITGVDEGVEPDWSKCSSGYVVDVLHDKVILAECELTPESEAQMTIRRVVNDLTETDGLPYDSIYVEYLLAKMALYQHDYNGYNAHMTQYNVMYDALRKDYKTRSSLNRLSAFKNYWYA